MQSFKKLISLSDENQRVNCLVSKIFQRSEFFRPAVMLAGNDISILGF